MAYEIIDFHTHPFPDTAANINSYKDEETLEDYLQNHVFTGMKQITVSPDPEDETGFNRYMDRFISCIPAQKAAADHFKD